MLEKRNDLILIMPTGPGKTDMILLTTWIEKFRCNWRVLTVVIVPFIAISRDIMRRCDEVGIRAALWSSSQLKDLEFIDLIPFFFGAGRDSFVCQNHWRTSQPRNAGKNYYGRMPNNREMG